jgi:NAD(P)-dependent dehydrogenase (short-subunit alcohol dehydrogenase family)
VRVAQSVTIVTGAAHGIGRATALALARDGAEISAVDRDAAALGEVEVATGGLSIAVDVTDLDHADQVVDATLARYGRIDAVVINAGIGYAGDFATMPVADLVSLLEINLRAPMLMARAALPPMLAQGSGSLVFITSIAGTVPVPTEAAYCVSKTALESFADSLREEVRAAGITVSTVRPGVVRTGFLEQRNLPYSRRWPRPVPPEGIAQAVVGVLESGAERRTEPPWLDLASRTRRRLPWLYREMSRRLG